MKTPREMAEEIVKRHYATRIEQYAPPNVMDKDAELLTWEIERAIINYPKIVAWEELRDHHIAYLKAGR